VACRDCLQVPGVNLALDPPRVFMLSSLGMTSILEHLKGSVRYPEFWTYSGWLDIVTRYRRNVLGLAWIPIPVLVFIAVIGGVYSTIMGREPEFYIPYLGIGYLVWRFMVQCLTDSVLVLRGHKPFIMDGRVRLTDFVLRAVAKAFFYFVCSLPVVAGVLIWSPEMHVSTMVTMLVTLPVVIANILWVSVCMSLIGARFADAAEMVNTALRFGMLLTPIIWVGERFQPGSLWWWAVHLNPAYHLITIVRAPMLGYEIQPQTYWYIAVMTIAGWGLAALLYRRYARFVPLWI